MDEARQYLYDLGIFQHLKPNGLFAFDTTVTPRDRRVCWGMPDSGCAMTAAVSEMLIQSCDGVIRLAPAVPPEWDASFSGFLTVGAFEVDAEITGGRARSASVTSLNGNRCRMINPWAGREITVRLGRKAHPFTEAAGVISFETKPGKTYAIAGPKAGGGAGKKSPREREAPSYTGPAHMGRIPPERRETVFLGIPPEAPSGRKAMT